jgi:membrane protease YdiL (CAAX protease family)
LRIAVVTALSLALAIAIEPPRPVERIQLPAAIAIGTFSGSMLFSTLAGRLPRLHIVAPASVLVARVGFFGLWAANEEVVWRRVVLGELLGAGVVPAFAASTVGFALVHRTRRGVHLCTGGVFGLLYLATGVLASSIAAHWAYNVLVADIVDRDRLRAEAPP